MSSNLTSERAHELQARFVSLKGDFQAIERSLPQVVDKDDKKNKGLQADWSQATLEVLEELLAINQKQIYCSTEYVSALFTL
jgi:hypothetical protein